MGVFTGIGLESPWVSRAFSQAYERFGGTDTLLGLLTIKKILEVAKIILINKLNETSGAIFPVQSTGLRELPHWLINAVVVRALVKGLRLGRVDRNITVALAAATGGLLARTSIDLRSKNSLAASLAGGASAALAGSVLVEAIEASQKGEPRSDITYAAIASAATGVLAAEALGMGGIPD